MESERVQLARVWPLVLAVGMFGCATRHSSPAPPATLSVPFKLGDAIVHAEAFQRGRLVPTMINVHDDEDTSAAAGKIVVSEHGGRLIELAHTGRRHIRFGWNGGTFRFDPNRIFSDAGIRATLSRQGAWTEAAHDIVKDFATQYLDHFGLEREPVIIALHNTAEGSYSVRSYRAGAEHAAAAAAIHVSARRSPFDFFYVTDARFFEWLKQRDFNVVLQDNACVPDDGSLSVHFAWRGVPYVNIEAERGHLDAQIEMVRAACAMAGELGLTPRP